jgi:hypothetical protein
MWHSIPGYPNIEVSDELEFRSLAKEIVYARKDGLVICVHRKQKNLKIIWPAGLRYPHVAGGGARRQIRVHILVCLAFHGLPPKGREFALHRDGKIANYKPWNLYWGNQKQNMLDALQHGTFAMGERQYNAKLTDIAVRHIRSSNKSCRELGVLYSVHENTIRDVLKNRTWKHIK